jgi:MerR family transcriptional regulator, thiopeptide resistance regulator
LPALLFGHCITTTGSRLLSPAHRSERGYRLYCHEDLGRLERILALRYLGLSLREIAALLNAPVAVEQSRSPSRLPGSGRRCGERRDGLDRVLRAIEDAQRRAQDPERTEGAEPEWLLYQTILKEIHMQETTDWTAKYYSPDALTALRSHRSSHDA